MTPVIGYSKNAALLVALALLSGSLTGCKEEISTEDYSVIKSLESPVISSKDDTYVSLSDSTAKTYVVQAPDTVGYSTITFDMGSDFLTTTNYCGGKVIFGSTGTAVCEASGATGSDVTASRLLVGSRAWNSSPTGVVGTMNNLGLLSGASGLTGVSGFMTGITSPTGINFCSSAANILGVAGTRLCLASPVAFAASGSVTTVAGSVLATYGAFGPSGTVVTGNITNAGAMNASAALPTLPAYFSSLTGIVTASGVCTTTTSPSGIIGIAAGSGTAPCLLPSSQAAFTTAAASGVTSAEVLSGYSVWNASGVAINGSLVNRGVWDLKTDFATAGGAGYYTSYTNAPTGGQICNDRTVLGVAGAAACRRATFSAQGFVNNHGTYQSIAVGDLNSDGKPDVVAASTGAFMDVFTGTFTGATFTSLTSTLEQASNGAGLVMGDFNRDGFLDFVSCSGASCLFLGNTSSGSGGTLSVSLQQTVTGFTGASGVVSGDFNRDGMPDIAVLDPSGGTVKLSLNNGTGTPFAAATVISSSIINPMAAVVGDFDRDGKLDLAVAAESAGVQNAYLFYGNGDGTFQAPKTFDMTAGLSSSGTTYVSGIDAADLDGDGYLDLVVTGYLYSGLKVIKSAGSALNLQSPTLVESGSLYRAVKAGDFSSDGSPDFVVGDDVGVARIFVNNSNGSSFTARSVVSQVYPILSLAVSDINLDGKQDILIGSQRPEGMLFYLGQ